MLRAPLDTRSPHFSELASDEGLNSVRARGMKIHSQDILHIPTFFSPEAQLVFQFFIE